ncbi:MAG: hypothetical protein GXO00_02485 [Candidatus Diapherotrites archaeon]|nr:hypothetical protein [Candidatus Diapherotrites archaeon]
MFGRYDVRGIWGKDLTVETVRRLGDAVRRAVGDVPIAVGKDARYSSHLVFYHLLEGLSGDVIDIGITTTPMSVYYAWKEGAETLQITASHNPPEYIGIKFTHPGGDSWSHEEIQGLRSFYEEAKGGINPHNLHYDRSFLFDYYDEFERFPEMDVEAVVDFSNGVGYLEAPVMERKLRVVFLNYQPDGRFPRHSPDPTVPDAQKDILDHPVPFGAVLDGDADRIVFKRHGRILKPEEVIADVAQFYGVKRVVIDTMISLSLERYLEDIGVRVYRSRTGRIFLRKMAKEKGADFFGEYSGHYGFKEFNYIDDSLYAFLSYARIVDADFQSEYVPWPSSGVKSVKGIQDLDERLLQLFDPDEVIDTDGLDMRKDGSRIVVRRSGSEPGKWRLFWEAEDQGEFERLGELIRSAVDRPLL